MRRKMSSVEEYERLIGIYRDDVSYLLEEVRELEEQVDALTKRIEELESEASSLARDLAMVTGGIVTRPYRGMDHLNRSTVEEA